MFAPANSAAALPPIRSIQSVASASAVAHVSNNYAPVVATVPAKIVPVVHDYPRVVPVAKSANMSDRLAMAHIGLTRNLPSLVAAKVPPFGISKGFADLFYTPFRGNGSITLKGFAPMQTAVTATSISAAATQITFRSRQEVICSDEGFRLVFCNYKSASVGGASGISEASAANTITVKASVEHWVSGSLQGTYKVYFNGQRTYTIDIDGTSTSDIVPCPVTRTVGSAPTDVLFVRTCVTVSNTANEIPLTVNGRQSSTVTYNRSGEGEGRISGDHTDDASTITVGNVLLYGPTAVLGASGRTKSLGVFGDSIMWGQAGALDEFGAINRRGFLDGVSVVNLARGSDQMANVVSPMYSMRRLQVALQSCAAFYTNLGTNDLNTLGATAIQLATNVNAWHTKLRKMGRPSYHSTLIPRNTSSDNFLTYAGQTKPSWEAQRILFNDWLRGVHNSVWDSVGSPTCSGYVELCTYLETDVNGTLTLNGGYWLCVPTPVSTGTVTSGTNTTVTTGAASTTQLVGSTTGMAISGTLYFATAGVSRTISSVTDSTHVVLTATVTTTTGETVQQTTSTTTLTDTGGSYGTYAWNTTTGAVSGLLGQYVKITSGASAGTVKQITGSTTASTFTYAGAIPLGLGDTYSIYTIYTNDGTHPSDSGIGLMQSAYPNLQSFVNALLSLNTSPQVITYGPAYSI